VRHRKRSDFGFPRWGGYGRDTDAVHVRMCDREGCSERGDHPAPKSPGSPQRWYFCEAHAAEYNRNWNYFAGMNEAEARARMQAEEAEASGFRQSSTYSWGGVPDSDGVTGAERDAYAELDLEAGASAGDVKARFRSLAKIWHPDRNPGDKEAERRFHRIRAAYEILRPRLQEQA